MNILDRHLVQGNPFWQCKGHFKLFLSRNVKQLGVPNHEHNGKQLIDEQSILSFLSWLVLSLLQLD
ncbi:hypothetical protein EDD64_12356 [Effusibacillus lacus]|nr:hypothetical protein EDD64_12356 [Effusibacillus lacus]